MQAGTLTDPKLRGKLLMRMVQADPARAWQMLMSSGLPVSQGDVHSIADAWYGKEPAAAAAFGLTLTDPLQRPAFLQRVLSKWMLEKPGAFATWFHTQPKELDLARYLSTSGVTYHAGSATLAELDSLLQVNPGFANFSQFLGDQLGRLWSKPDQREATLAWLRRVDDPAMRDTLWKHVVAAASEEDPHAAAKMVAEIGDAKLSREASSTVAANLARKDPRAALQYAATLPDATAARGAWQSAMSTWGLKAPAQALAYLQQNISTLQPELLGPVLRNLGESQPAEALALASALPASSERSLAVLEVFSTWRARQPEAAKRWMESEQAAFLPSTEKTVWKSLSMPRISAPNSQSYSLSVNGRVLHYTY